MSLMRILLQFLVIALVLLSGCGSADRPAQVQNAVRTYLTTVARDITQEGAAAWRRHFIETPAFLMAVDDHIEFADSAAVDTKLPEVARAIKRIGLRWGDDLRVDAITADLAAVVTSWHEDIENADGSRVPIGGLLTGLLEQHEGRWRFRNLHWSITRAAKQP